MAKEPHQKTTAELAQDLSTRPDSLVHLTARAEMARRAAVPGPVAELDHARFRGDRSARCRRFGLLGLLRLSQFAP